MGGCKFDIFHISHRLIEIHMYFCDFWHFDTFKSFVSRIYFPLMYLISSYSQLLCFLHTFFFVFKHYNWNCGLALIGNVGGRQITHRQLDEVNVTGALTRIAFGRAQGQCACAVHCARCARDSDGAKIEIVINLSAIELAKFVNYVYVHQPCNLGSGS